MHKQLSEQLTHVMQGDMQAAKIDNMLLKRDRGSDIGRLTLLPPLAMSAPALPYAGAARLLCEWQLLSPGQPQGAAIQLFAAPLTPVPHHLRSMDSLSACSFSACRAGCMLMDGACASCGAAAGCVQSGRKRRL